MYGIEATLTKASGSTSDPMISVVQRKIMHLIIACMKMGKRLQRCRTVFHV